jgi:hypothetical protein
VHRVVVAVADAVPAAAPVAQFPIRERVREKERARIITETETGTGADADPDAGGVIP